MAPKVTLEHKETTKERILDAAERPFQRRGHHETSMDDIVRESGTSKGATCGYFEGKEDLFRRLHDRSYAQNFEGAAGLLAEGGSGVEDAEFREGLDTDATTSLLIATIDGLILRWATTDSKIDWKRARDAMVDLVLHGTVAATPPSLSR